MRAARSSAAGLNDTVCVFCHAFQALAVAAREFQFGQVLPVVIPRLSLHCRQHDDSTDETENFFQFNFYSVFSFNLLMTNIANRIFSVFSVVFYSLFFISVWRLHISSPDEKKIFTTKEQIPT